MKIHGKLNQLTSDYGGCFLNIHGMDGCGLAVWTLIENTYLLTRKDGGGIMFCQHINMKDWLESNKEWTILMDFSKRASSDENDS